MPRQTSLQITEATDRQVAFLQEQGFGTFTDIVRIAIDRMCQEESRKRMEDTLNKVLAGEIEPDTSDPTFGETFYYHNDTTPLEDVGRCPGKTGIHILRRPDGSLTAHGGYHLRRPGEVWEDFILTMER